MAAMAIARFEVIAPNIDTQNLVCRVKMSIQIGCDIHIHHPEWRNNRPSSSIGRDTRQLSQTGETAEELH
jgi:hypothetical protein